MLTKKDFLMKTKEIEDKKKKDANVIYFKILGEIIKYMDGTYNDLIFIDVGCNKQLGYSKCLHVGMNDKDIDNDILRRLNGFLLLNKDMFENTIEVRLDVSTLCPTFHIKIVLS